MWLVLYLFICLGNGHGNGIAENFNDYRVKVEDPNAPQNKNRAANSLLIDIRHGKIHEIAIIIIKYTPNGDELLLDYGQKYWDAILDEANGY